MPALRVDKAGGWRGREEGVGLEFGNNTVNNCNIHHTIYMYMYSSGLTIDKGSLCV
jgi:hypothetical protein